MKENDGVDISNYIFSAIDKGQMPVTTDEIVSPLLTGQLLPDALLKEVSLGILKAFAEMKIIRADSPLQHGGNIYGLTDEGILLRAAFKVLSGTAS